MSCPICLTNEIRYKCNDCVEGGICHECSATYCPSGWSYTTNKNEIKCPVCRQIQYKWIYSECVYMMVYDVGEESYHFQNLDVYKIIERNICDHEREEEERENMSKEDPHSLLKPDAKVIQDYVNNATYFWFGSAPITEETIEILIDELSSDIDINDFDVKTWIVRNPDTDKKYIEKYY